MINHHPPNNQGEKILEIDLDLIDVNPHQPRKEFNQEELEQLSFSIQSVGIIHPPTVRPKGDRFELIAGERRIRAAKLAGLKKTPVYILETEKPISSEASLIENIQRVDLNPLEIAEALSKLLREFSLTQEEVAIRVGKKRSTITNYLRLLSLPPSIQKSLRQETIQNGHAKAILSLDGKHLQEKLHQKIVELDLSVRRAEELAKKIAMAPNPQSESARNNIYLDEISRKIREKLGTKVSILAKGKKGKICIDYFSYDDLDRILLALGVEGDE